MQCSEKEAPLLDTARTERGGMTTEESMRPACLKRLRPILMTTNTPSWARFPWFSTGTGSEIRRPLGYAIVGGLAESQLLTLFTHPVVYLSLDRLGRWRSGRAAPVPAAAAPAGR